MADSEQPASNPEPRHAPWRARSYALLRPPADPLRRALLVFLTGMLLLLLVDIVSEPRGRVGQDRAIAGALSESSHALSAVTDPESDASGDEDAALRRERAQSAAFFVEQAGLAWRRGDAATPAQVRAETGAAAVLAFLGKLWVLGWLLLPLGALAARIACPRAEARHRHWPIIYGANALGGSGFLIALALGAYALGVPAPFVLAPLVSMVVVLNAWMLKAHAAMDHTATLLRLAPILVILTVGLIFARSLLQHLAILS